MRQTQFDRARFFLAGRVAPLLLLAVVAGCGKNEGTVSGRVLYREKGVPGAIVTFVPTERGRNQASARTREDGSYELKVATGEAQIMVDNQELKPRPKIVPPVLPPEAKLPPPEKQNPPPTPEAAKAQDTYVELPEKYSKIESSGLRYTVKSGPQTHDVELK
jgi:hypothetical protein